MSAARRKSRKPTPDPTWRGKPGGWREERLVRRWSQHLEQMPREPVQTKGRKNR